jgi:hypothetical protein
MRTSKALGAALAGLVVLAACASTPDYREATSQRGPGYAEARIESNRYSVSYRLNNDDYNRARELAMRRAAELTLESGFDTFELVTESSSQETERDRYDRTSGPDRVLERDCGLLGCTTSVRNAPGDPFGDAFDTERSTVTATLEIVLSDKDANVSPSLYDASEVFANLSN